MNKKSPYKILYESYCNDKIDFEEFEKWVKKLQSSCHHHYYIMEDEFEVQTVAAGGYRIITDHLCSNCGKHIRYSDSFASELPIRLRRWNDTLTTINDYNINHQY